MSLKTKARIKELQNSGFRVPLGANGQLIDMASGLDLQQQFLLEGTCITTIEKTSTQDIITEIYPQKNLMMIAYIPGSSSVTINNQVYKQPDIQIQMKRIDDEENTTLLHTKYAYIVTDGNTDQIYEMLDYIDGRFLLPINEENVNEEVS